MHKLLSQMLLLILLIVSYQAKASQPYPSSISKVPETSTQQNSAYTYKQPFSMNVNVSLLPEWKAGAAKLEQIFEQVRDERLYTDPVHPQFKRRAIWLYPVDGCYIRAAHMARGFERRGFVRAGKVFAFGTWATLRARTKFAPTGAAWWTFHTAAAYRIGNRAFVLDPAIDPTRVLPFEEWIGLVAPDPSKIQVAICDANAYTPEQSCRGGSNSADFYLKDQMEELLDDEWNNLADLGFDPSSLLGDEPPWNNAFTLQ